MRFIAFMSADGRRKVAVNLHQVIRIDEVNGATTNIFTTGPTTFTSVKGSFEDVMAALNGELP